MCPSGKTMDSTASHYVIYDRYLWSKMAHPSPSTRTDIGPVGGFLYNVKPANRKKGLDLEFGLAGASSYPKKLQF
jgi:hypothetical protein